MYKIHMGIKSLLLGEFHLIQEIHYQILLLLICWTYGHCSRHRHFVGFFNMLVQAPTRGQPFYGYSEKQSHFRHLLGHAWGYRRHILVLHINTSNARLSTTTHCFFTAGIKANIPGAIICCEGPPTPLAGPCRPGPPPGSPPTYLVPSSAVRDHQHLWRGPAVLVHHLGRPYRDLQPGPFQNLRQLQTVAHVQYPPAIKSQVTCTFKV